MSTEDEKWISIEDLKLRWNASEDLLKDMCLHRTISSYGGEKEYVSIPSPFAPPLISIRSFIRFNRKREAEQKINESTKKNLLMLADRAFQHVKFFKLAEIEYMEKKTPYLRDNIDDHIRNAGRECEMLYDYLLAQASNDSSPKRRNITTLLAREWKTIRPLLEKELEANKKQYRYVRKSDMTKKVTVTGGQERRDFIGLCLQRCLQRYFKDAPKIELLGNYQELYREYKRIINA